MLKKRNEEETAQKRNRAGLGSQHVTTAKLCYPCDSSGYQDSKRLNDRRTGRVENGNGWSSKCVLEVITAC